MTFSCGSAVKNNTLNLTLLPSRNGLMRSTLVLDSRLSDDLEVDGSNPTQFTNRPTNPLRAFVGRLSSFKVGKGK